jgi:hypothetical protein
MFFFEKKNQKTFASLSRSYPQHLPEDIKVFCFPPGGPPPFFKKEGFLFLFSTSGCRNQKSRALF